MLLYLASLLGLLTLASFYGFSECFHAPSPLAVTVCLLFIAQRQTIAMSRVIFYPEMLDDEPLFYHSMFAPALA
jgi:hypothetical protein